jgi:hypothetical protein
LSSVSENQTTTAGGGELSFQTRNNGNGNTLAEKMRINNAGNVGIGIAVPTQKLDVVGNVKFSGALMPNNSAGTSGQVLTSSGAGTPPTWSSATTRVLGYVGRGSDIILGNLKVRLAATGNVSLQVSTVAGVISILGPSYFGNGNDYYISNMVVTTTPTYLNSNATTPSAGELIKAELMDVNNLISWRITAITGSGYNNNFICIEKL